MTGRLENKKISNIISMPMFSGLLFWEHPNCFISGSIISAILGHSYGYLHPQICFVSLGKSGCSNVANEYCGMRQSVCNATNNK